MATVFKTIQNRLMALLDSDTYVPATYLINPDTGLPADQVQGTEDAVAPADPTGVFQALVAVDTPTNRGADGDNVAAIGTRKGEQRGIVQIVGSDYVPVGFNSSLMTSGQNALSTSAEEVIAANSARVHARITNDDAAIKIYVGFDATVTTANGDVLKPGATMEFPGYTGAIWAIAASGTPLVTFNSW